jgi:hypothetical protein
MSRATPDRHGTAPANTVKPALNFPAQRLPRQEHMCTTELHAASTQIGQLCVNSTRLDTVTGAARNGGYACAPHRYGR